MTSMPPDHKGNSRKEFRQSGLQPQRRDVSGMIIVIVILAVIVTALVTLHPRPF